MAGPKMTMPSGFGGLMRYFDEYKSKIMIKPDHVVFMAVIFLIIVIILHATGIIQF